MPQSVGIFGASETENASVAHVPTRLYVFPPLAGPPLTIPPAEVVVVEGPVMIKVVKSKRIYEYIDYSMGCGVTSLTSFQN